MVIFGWEISGSNFWTVAFRWLDGNETADSVGSEGMGKEKE